MKNLVMNQHATENHSTSLSGINFRGRYEILFSGNFAIRKSGTAKNQPPLSTPKGQTESKVWILHNIGKNHCIIATGIDSLTFPVRDIKQVDLLWWDQQLTCWSLVTLSVQSASLQVSAVANHKLPVEKTTTPIRMPSN